MFTQWFDISMNSHQCGTVVAGLDPATSVLDPWCRSHDVANLWVVDGGFFPSSAAMNPALTIAAQALRVVAESDLARLTDALAGLVDLLLRSDLERTGHHGHRVGHADRLR